MDKRSSLKNEYHFIVDEYPDAPPAMELLSKVLCDIEDLAGFTPPPVDQSQEWAAIVSSAEESCGNYCKSLRGQTLFSALYGTYTVPLNELTAVLKSKHHTKQ
jgi:hypothetical protein